MPRLARKKRRKEKRRVTFFQHFKWYCYSIVFALIYGYLINNLYTRYTNDNVLYWIFLKQFIAPYVMIILSHCVTASFNKGLFQPEIMFIVIIHLLSCGYIDIGNTNAVSKYIKNMHKKIHNNLSLMVIVSIVTGAFILVESLFFILIAPVASITTLFNFDYPNHQLTTLAMLHQLLLIVPLFLYEFNNFYTFNACGLYLIIVIIYLFDIETFLTVQVLFGSVIYLLLQLQVSIPNYYLFLIIFWFNFIFAQFVPSYRYSKFKDLREIVMPFCRVIAALFIVPMILYQCLFNIYPLFLFLCIISVIVAMISFEEFNETIRYFSIIEFILLINILLMQSYDVNNCILNRISTFCLINHLFPNLPFLKNYILSHYVPWINMNLKWFGGKTLKEKLLNKYYSYIHFLVHNHDKYKTQHQHPNKTFGKTFNHKNHSIQCIKSQFEFYEMSVKDKQKLMILPGATITSNIYCLSSIISVIYPFINTLFVCYGFINLEEDKLFLFIGIIVIYLFILVFMVKSIVSTNESNQSIVLWHLELQIIIQTMLLTEKLNKNHKILVADRATRKIHFLCSHFPIDIACIIALYAGLGSSGFI